MRLSITNGTQLPAGRPPAQRAEPTCACGSAVAAPPVAARTQTSFLSNCALLRSGDTILRTSGNLHRAQAICVRRLALEVSCGVGCACTGLAAAHPACASIAFGSNQRAMAAQVEPLPAQCLLRSGSKLGSAFSKRVRAIVSVTLVIDNPRPKTPTQGLARVSCPVAPVLQGSELGQVHGHEPKAATPHGDDGLGGRQHQEAHAHLRQHPQQSLRENRLGLEVDLPRQDQHTR